jgi:putative holliday junction resolvase
VRREPDATVLAFDFGTRRIGVAVGNTLTGTAHPLTTIAADDASRRFDAIAALLDEWRPQRLVVGLPVHADGTEHAMTVQARAFAAELARRFALPVALEDERHSSQVARDALRVAGRGRRADRALRDRVAAQIILQAWLDARDDA